MIFVWGKKIVYRNAGYVADYCYVCREIQPFKLTRVGLSGHIYYLTVSQGRLAGYEMTCQCCKAIYETDIVRYQKTEKKNIPLMELIQNTYPSVNVVYQEQIQYEQNLRFNAASLTNEQRGRFVENMLSILHLKLAKRFEKSHLDGKTLLSIVAAFFLCIAALEGMRHFDLSSQMGPHSVLIPFALAIAGIIWIGLGARARYVKREILPIVHKAFEVIHPTEDEFKSALNYLEKSGFTYMKKVKLKELMSVCQSQNINTNHGFK